MSEHRVRYAALFDEETRPHHERLRAAMAIGPDDRVLDVGCGTGQSTRAAARLAREVVGVDISDVALAHAREVSVDLDNIEYVCADAEHHHFPPESFDVCVSQFGVMFFADPVIAFTNIARSLRPGGRLVVLVWQAADRNEWCTAIRDALGVTEPDDSPFSLGDPAVADRVLTLAGFTDIDRTDVHEPVHYGPDATAAYDFVAGLREPKAVLTGENASEAGKRLRALLADHTTDRGVVFDSRAWLIEAHR
jgi:SAM-dependent methyltransferase